MSPARSMEDSDYESTEQPEIDLQVSTYILTHVLDNCVVVVMVSTSLIQVDKQTLFEIAASINGILNSIHAYSLIGGCCSLISFSYVCVCVCWE